MKELFDRKFRVEHGRETKLNVISEKTFATFDSYIACSKYSSLPQCREFHAFFETRAKLYQHFDGTNE